jgi:hypothetical protein
MPIEGATNSVRYLDRNLLGPQQEITKGLFNEIIRQYGVDVTYFRHNTTAFESPSSSIYNYTYGEETTKVYSLSADMIVYMEMQGDSLLLSKFGMETDGDATIFIGKEPFTEQYRDLIGTQVTNPLYSSVSGTLSGFSGIISGTVINSDLNGFTSAQIVVSEDTIQCVREDEDINFSRTIETEQFRGFEVSGLCPISGDFFGLYEENWLRTPKPFVRYMKETTGYYTDRSVLGILSGGVDGYIDVSGNGWVSGNISGDLTYFNDWAGNESPNWEISPQVGDFFRISFDEFNYEEYEVTQIRDRDLNADGLNPLLSRYIWKLDCVRRDPSYELDGSGNVIEEAITSDKRHSSDLAETVSDDIFDYGTEEIDSVDSDPDQTSIYGGYGWNG